MTKSRDAFRTISEVSEALDTPAHVLRFWESKFSQVKPVKRAGGRRYYRPSDVELLAGIKRLLHQDGLTIKGAQKLLREQGVKHVASLGEVDLTGAGDAKEAETIEATPASKPVPEAPSAKDPEPTNVVSLSETSAEPADAAEAEPEPVIASAPIDEPAAPAPEPAAPVTPSPAKISVPDDPSDADSKLPARFFHHLQQADPQRLRAKATEIAPLLDRMQVLRDRIHVR
ncbi:MAG: MerR family transcriptional regulator [Pseudomonadota bacterium]